MLVILWKDLQLELRKKERLSSAFVLALLIVLVFVFALDVEKLGQPKIVASFLWISLLFSGMLSFPRAFQIEEERNCMAGLLLSPIDAGSLYLAKFLGNVCVLCLVGTTIVPITLVLVGLGFSFCWMSLGLVLFLGIVGLSALGTSFGAIAVRTSAGEAILPIMLLPLLVPLLLAVVNITGAVLVQEIWTGPWFRVLVAFDVIFVVTGWLTFDAIVRE